MIDNIYSYSNKYICGYSYDYAYDYAYNYC